MQESLGLLLDKVRQEHNKATLLASPLYVLYAKASAYRDAYGIIFSYFKYKRFIYIF